MGESGLLSLAPDYVIPLDRVLDRIIKKRRPAQKRVSTSKKSKGKGRQKKKPQKKKKKPAKNRKK
jgi:hypothetical protein